jgi:Xaa-Pro dipeptidase
MRITPLQELQNRCESLQALLLEEGIDAALLVQNSDLFYFTGSIQRGAIYLPAVGEPVYFVIKDHGRARMESGLRQVLPLEGFKQLPEQLRQQGLTLPPTLGLELDVLPVLQYQRLSRLFPQAQAVDVSPLVRRLRACKSGYELDIMQDCALIAEKVHEYAKTLIKAGTTDLDIAAELECFARKEGHQGVIRFRGFNAELHFGHVLSGSDGAVPTFLDAPLGGLGVNPAVGQGASYKTIAAGEPVIVDFILAYDGYLVDQTRTFVVGTLEEQLQRAYTDMLSIQQALTEIAAPGVSWSEVYRHCSELADTLGYAENFMGSVGAQVAFIGHGIGIEVDEYPFIARGFEDQLLQENMTFAFEPKAVFPGKGAVGIENTWQVTGSGLRRLTRANEDLVELS